MLKDLHFPIDRIPKKGYNISNKLEKSLIDEENYGVHKRPLPFSKDKA